MIYTQEQLSTIVDSLTARLNTIDGQGLAPNVQSTITQLNAKITGLKADLNQIVLTFENQLTLMQIAVTSIQTQITNITNIK